MHATSLRRFLPLAVIAPLAACSGGGQSNPGFLTDDGAIRTEVDQQLAQSAARASNAVETLAMIQRARTEPRPSALDETQLPEELRRKVTLEWSGPATELVKQLAGNVGYSYIETGRPVSAPGMVSVNIHDASAAKALEDVGLQIERYATLVVDPNLRRIEYRNEAAEGGRLPGAPAAAPAPVARRHVARPAATTTTRHTGSSDAPVASNKQ